jgi:hypothetical protein
VGKNAIAVPAASAPANIVANVASNEVANVSANEVPANETPAANVANVSANTVERAPSETRAEKRIKQLLAQKKEADAEAEYWRTQAQVKPAETDKPPVIEDFQNYDDFLVAKTSHALKQGQAAEQAQRAQRMAQTAVTEVFQARIDEAAKENPEILDIMQDRTFLPGNNPMSHVIAAVIKESEMAPEVIQYLYDNQDEVKKMYRMSPGAAAREIGKLEYKLSIKPKPERKIESQAPPPVLPIEPKGPQNVELDKVPMEDFVKRRNQAQFGKK